MAADRTRRGINSSSPDQSSPDDSDTVSNPKSNDTKPNDSFSDALKWAQASQVVSPTKSFFSYKILGIILIIIVIIVVVWLIIKYSSNKETDECSTDENKEGENKDMEGVKTEGLGVKTEGLGVKTEGLGVKTEGLGVNSGIRKRVDKNTIDQINNPKNQLSALGPSTESKTSSKTGLDPKILPTFFDDDPADGDYVFVYEEM